MQLIGWLYVALASGWHSMLPPWALAALAFALLLGFRGFFHKRRIQPVGWNRRQLLHEFIFSAMTLIAGVFIGPAIEALTAHGLAVVPSGPVSPWVIVGEFALYFVLFDAYFYFIHRAFHSDWLYWMHKHHHRSEAPNPLTALSFHPLEALLTGGFVVLVVVIFHIHLYSLIVVNAYGLLNGILIHSGHEVFPRWWYEHPLSRLYISPLYHDRHHQSCRYNFGGFTTVWDRLLGTMQPGFAEDYCALQRRIAESDTTR